MDSSVAARGDSRADDGISDQRKFCNDPAIEAR